MFGGPAAVGSLVNVLTIGAIRSRIAALICLLFNKIEFTSVVGQQAYFFREWVLKGIFSQH